MRLPLLLALAIAASGFSSASLACVEPDTPTFRENLDSATSVVVVRLMSLGLADTSQNSRDLAGKLQVVRVLKGSPEFQLRGDRSIVDISVDYIPTIPAKRESQLWQTRFADYLAGKALPKSFNPLPVMLPVHAFPPAPEAQW